MRTWNCMLDWSGYDLLGLMVAVIKPLKHRDEDSNMIMQDQCRFATRQSKMIRIMEKSIEITSDILEIDMI